MGRPRWIHRTAMLALLSTEELPVLRNHVVGSDSHAALLMVVGRWTHQRLLGWQDQVVLVVGKVFTTLAAAVNLAQVNGQGNDAGQYHTAQSNKNSVGDGGIVCKNGSRVDLVGNNVRRWREPILIGSVVARFHVIFDHSGRRDGESGTAGLFLDAFRIVRRHRVDAVFLVAQIGQ